MTAVAAGATPERAGGVPAHGRTGPVVVALGGGHGLSATLRAVRQYAGAITGIVSVADDGGSSGRLRRAFGIPAPGDLRKCLVALAEPGSIWADAFEHRFTASELEGHALGNIVLAGLTEVTGDFERAIDLANSLLAGVGRLVPATREPVVLKATYRTWAGGPEREVHGQANVKETGGITGVSVVPDDPEVPVAALDAIAAADQIVVGPGSLFTSILAVASVPAIRDALAGASGQKVYVANLQEQRPETDGFDVAAHVDALHAHGVAVDVVLHDPITLPLGRVDGPRVVGAALAAANTRLHDPLRLAKALAALLDVPMVA